MIKKMIVNKRKKFKKTKNRKKEFYLLILNVSLKVTVHRTKVCLFWVFVLLENFFTHMGTSPLPVKGCKIRPMLGTYGL